MFRGFCPSGSGGAQSAGFGCYRKIEGDFSGKEVKQLNHLGRNDACWCGSGKKYKKCHGPFDDKPEPSAAQGRIVPKRGIIKTAEQIAGIKKARRSMLPYWITLQNISKRAYAQQKLTAGYMISLQKQEQCRHHSIMKGSRTVSAHPSITRSAMAFRRRRLYSWRGILSMWMFPRS